MVVRKMKIKRRVLGHKDRWDGSCTKRKKEVKRIYRKWKVSNGTREEYVGYRKSLREKRKLLGEEKERKTGGRRGEVKEY